MTQSFEAANEFNDLLDTIQGNIALQIANAIYIKKGFTIQPDYDIIVKDYFYSMVKSVNFENSQATANEINNYVANKTNNNVHDLISPASLTSRTSIVLVNAIYFKGTWKTQFNPQSTMKGKFYGDGYCYRFRTKASALVSTEVDYMSVVVSFV